MRDWRNAGTTLGKALLLGDAPEALIAQRDPLDFRCDVEDRRLDAVPWELSCLPDHQQVVALTPSVATLYRTNGRRAAQLDEGRFAQAALNRLIVQRDRRPARVRHRPTLDDIGSR
ncbi:MAG: hypothetical protein QOF58_457 [Pseudonocardiales bacterium]|nr:hypothetical protein [Pseudonocardiales bacterium]